MLPWLGWESSFGDHSTHELILYFCADLNVFSVSQSVSGGPPFPPFWGREAQKSFGKYSRA